MAVDFLDRRALGRRLSLLANASAGELMQQHLPSVAATAARRIGFTGAPGAGKSTLLGHLVLQRKDKGRRGVLAVDPSSPKSGGAILGDRIRMDDLEGMSELYIRSLGSRSATDGLADNIPEMLDAMDEFRFDEVYLETVGVGQAEYAARAQVDTLVLVLLPDSGDAVQAMKSGIMEMADILVVNKADLPGAQKMAADINRIAAVMGPRLGTWVPSVLLVSASRPQTVEALSDEIDRHQEWLSTQGLTQSLRVERARYRLKRLIDRYVGAFIDAKGQSFFEQSAEVQAAMALDSASRNIANAVHGNQSSLP